MYPCMAGKYYCKERKSQKREKKISKLNLLTESDTVKERDFNIQSIIEHREETPNYI